MKPKNFLLDSLIELPFNLPGKVYRSPMPFRASASDGRLFQQYHEKDISVVVLLVGEEECMRRCGVNLHLFYIENGLEVIYLPIPDYQAPAMEDLTTAVQNAIDRACTGHNLVVHCNAGVGRTGMFLACMAKQCQGLSGQEAIRWVRGFIPGALETSEQIQIALDYYWMEPSSC